MSYQPRPGDYGVVKTRGVVAKLIRLVTLSRWNHAFIYIGDDLIVEARPTGVTISKASQYKVLAYNRHEEGLSDEQREKIVAFAKDQVGSPYGFIDIVVIFLRIFGLRIPFPDFWKKLALRKGFICSELTAESYYQAGFKLINKHSSIVTPGDLAERLIYQ